MSFKTEFMLAEFIAPEAALLQRLEATVVGIWSFINKTDVIYSMCGTPKRGGDGA